MAIAISGSFYAFLDAYLYSTLPVEDGARVVALENQDTKINQPERRKTAGIRRRRIPRRPFLDRHRADAGRRSGSLPT